MVSSQKETIDETSLSIQDQRLQKTNEAKIGCTFSELHTNLCQSELDQELSRLRRVPDSISIAAWLVTST